MCIDAESLNKHIITVLSRYERVMDTKATHALQKLAIQTEDIKRNYII